MTDARDALRESSERILRNTPELAGKLDWLRALSRHDDLRATVESVQQRVGTLEGLGEEPQLALETIVNRVGRPVLEVAGDDYVIEGPEAEVWQAQLSNRDVRAALRRVIPSVGRIEVNNHPELTWVGTGWLIAADVVVTNRHVANEFARTNSSADGPAFVFRRGWRDRSSSMTATVDFRRELHNSTPRGFQVLDVLHIEDDDGPDFAFLRVQSPGDCGPLSPSLRAATRAAAELDYVATIGYPAADSRIPDHDLMTRLFGDQYNVKRLSPGRVLRMADELVFHDCTTLGGNSGSPVVDLATGDVLALHFSGVFLRENRGVPILYVMSRLEQRLRPGRPGRERRAMPPAPQAAAVPPAAGVLPVLPAAPGPPAPPGVAVPAGAAVTFMIPLQISITIGDPAAANVVVAPAANDDAPAPPETVEEAVDVIRQALDDLGRSDILAVRDGFVFRDGWITSDPAVVVIHDGAVPLDLAALGLPAFVGAFPVEVRSADPWDIAAAQAHPEELEGLPRTSYTRPREFALEEVEEKMTVVCHVSPDAGWHVLSEFLGGTKSALTVGMYDFTALHIIDGVLGAVENGPRKLALVLQKGESLGGKPNDVPEEQTIERFRSELGPRFDYAPASVGAGHQFAAAYHIKVAVRDSRAFWLSSGNWQTSNQPDHGVAEGETSWDLLVNYNREWHVVVENNNLSRQFEKFLRYDLENARADAATEAVPPSGPLFEVDEAVEEKVPAGKPTYFAPLKVNRKLRVMPLLTPDNYQEHVLALIRSAKERILFQNQSLTLLDGDKNDERFLQLTSALLERKSAGIDVRIIIRGEFAPVGPLEQLQKRGFDMTKVRLQNRCHTKGIIVDGLRVLVGSHNWTNQGTLVNRDASLIFEDEEVARYFEKIFWFDWNNLTRQSLGPRRPRRVNSASESVTAGRRLVAWQEIVQGD